MKVLLYYVLISGALLNAVGCVTPIVGKITNQNFSQAGWEEEEVRKNMVPPPETTIQYLTIYVEIACIPDPPALDRGCVKFILPTTSDHGTRRIRLRNNAYDLLRLEQLTPAIYYLNTLKYSTYVVKHTGNANIQLQLQLDHNNDKILDAVISFDPGKQFSQVDLTGATPPFPQVIENEWQEWNAGAGWWSVETKADNIMLPESLWPSNPAEVKPLFTLGAYLNYFPNANIINAVIGQSLSGGIVFTVGDDQNIPSEFEGYMDLFKISIHRHRTLQSGFIVNVFDFDDPACRPNVRVRE